MRQEVFVFPLSFAQERLWFLNQLQPDSTAYHIPMAVRLMGHLGVAALECSLNEIIRRHEALRTTFAMMDGTPKQVIAPALELPLLVIDLQELSMADRGATARRLATDEARKPFNLAQGPLVRTTLLQLNLEEHVLLVTMHHIIADGWSVSVFFRELSALYQSYSSGRPSQLLELPIQYADFAVWQREGLQGEVYETQLTHWKRQLHGAPMVLELPTDHPRPAVQSFRGATQSCILPVTLAEQLQTLSRREGATLFMTLLAAFQTLLYRYTGQEDIIVGSPIAGRNQVETEELIGFFVNTLALRTDLSGNPSFRELVGRVRERALGAYTHQDLPFEKLVEALQPRRDLSRSPLFQVMFVLQNAPMGKLELPGLTLTSLEIESIAAKFDLTLFMRETAEGLKTTMEYSTDLFDATTITRMLGHFQTLLQGIVADANRRLSELTFLTEAEVRQVLGAWNRTEADYPQDVCVHELFEAQVELTPDAVALVFEDQQLTYHELNRRANQVAHYLRTLGVRPEVLVGLCIARSLEMVVGLLGILKAGGAYVPLDPSYPRERLEFMLADAQGPVLVTQEWLRGQLLAQEAKVVCVDTDWERISQESVTNMVSGVTAANVAYMIYTSGSTGQSKGVLIEHRQIHNYVQGIWERYDLEPGASFAMVQPLTVDSIQTVLFPCFMSGGCLHVIPQRTAADPEVLGAYFRRHPIDLLKIAPSHLAALQYSSQPEYFLPRRCLIIGGEASQPDWVATLQEKAYCAIFNHYGPTEATVGTLTYRIPQAAHGHHTATVPLGRSLPNAQAYVLDRYRQPVPLGVPGELYIGGRGLARGYLNHAPLTAEQFIPHPFSHLPGARLYKTGDLVRYLPDGNIEFLGRMDDQVKVRGFRIEPGEIEAVLGQHPAVYQAVVLARQDVPGDKRLVAYIVPQQEPPPTSSALCSFLQQKLPSYMVPAAFVLLAALPLTPHGKIDRQALPAPDWTRPALADAFVAPRNTLEQGIAETWQKLLGIEPVGIHDNFFELGGHSLLAVQVISRLRQMFQVELPVRSVFEAPTVAELAEYLAFLYEARPATSSSLPPLVPVARDGDLPLSFAQQRLWFLDQLEPGNPAYNMPVAYRVTGRLNVIALEQSLGGIIRRHDILRTTFPAVDGQPVQVISPDLAMSLPVMDLRDVPEIQREAMALRLATEEAQRPFNLAQGPLLRMQLLCLSAVDHVLLLTMHHIVSDGWSLEILIRELSVLYEAYAAEKPSPLPGLPIQYADFAYWERQCLQGEKLESLLSYWKGQLDGVPPTLDLPTDWPRPPIQTYRGARQALVLSQHLTAALKALSHQEQCTLFMTLLAAFKVLLSRYTGQDDLSVGMPIVGRTRAELEGLIGCFVNTLVLRTDLSGAPSFREVLRRVRAVCLEAYAHQELPFEKLVEELQPARDLSRTPLFQVFFNMLNLEGRALDLHGLTVQRLWHAESASKFDLTLYTREQSGEMHLLLVYNPDLFRRDRMVEMLAQFQQVLTQIVEHPEAGITRFSLVTPAAQSIVPNPTDVLDSTWLGAIHTHFSHQAQRFPERLAIVGPEKIWCYAELEARSNQLAHYLRAHGIKRQDIVAIYGHRSAALVWALLGVLKAGAAFLILDPAYPASRLIDYLRVAKPRGWIQLEAAGELPDTLEECVTTLACCCRLELPRHAPAAALDVYMPCSTDDPGVEVGPEDLAYVAFTSGSTGRPKGILGSHRPLSHFLHWQSQTFGLGASDRFSLLSGLSHDPLLRDIFTPLSLGATLCIPALEDIAPRQLAAWMQQEQVTITHLTPAMGQLLTETMLGTATAPCAVPLLRYVFSGGDVLTQGDVARLRKVAPCATFVNFYGATETPQAQGYYIVPAEEGDHPSAQERVTVPIGRGIAHVQLLVLTATQQLAGIGEKGEIYVRSPYLAQGYLSDEALTRERFMGNPFTTIPHDRLYKTGDLARYLPDGNLEFLGRLDQQVKIRGYRIELGEIEAVLEHHTAVCQAVVLAREDTPGDECLAAYVVPTWESAPTASALHSFLQAQLPAYMVPSAFVLLDALPLTPNGKVDRRALPAPDQARPELAEVCVAPRAPLEVLIAEVWQELLGVDRVGLYDNFFDLGGHSLLSMQVIAKIEKQTGLRLHPSDLMYHTLGQLAAACTEHMSLLQPLETMRFTHRVVQAIKRLFSPRTGTRT